MDNKVSQVLGVSMEKIKELVDVNTVIGTPIATPDGPTLIPVSRVTYGFAGGGSDLPSKSGSDLFGGGSGAGVTITPIAIISISNGQAQVLPLMAHPTSVDTLVNMIPGVVNQVSSLIADRKEPK